RIRHAVEHRIRALIAINPSTLTAFGTRLNENAERLVTELRAGTVLGDQRLPPNPARAKELDAILSKTGRLGPAQSWPDLKLLSCWRSAGASLSAPKLQELFGSVDMLAWMYGSSEGVMSLPIDRHPTMAPLTVYSGFFEFLPAGEDPPADGRTLLMQDVEPG